MKKLAAKRRKPVRRKPTVSAAKTKLRLAELEAIERFLADQAGDDGLVDMIEELIDTPLDSDDDIPDADTLAEFSDALDRVRVDANGGDPEARESLKEARGIIDRAARRDEIDPRILMTLGHVFATAQVDIGEAARASAARFLKSRVDGPALSIVPPALLSGNDDPFALYDQISALIDILPTDIKASIVEALPAEPAPQGSAVAVGFLLHGEEAVALAAIRGLAAADARGALEPVNRRRIGMIRNWLTPARKDALEAAIPSAEAAEPHSAIKHVKAMASACDGSGASALYGTAATGSRHVVASLMVKPAGVTETLLLEDLSKDDMASVMTMADRTAPMSEVPLATFSRLIRLALGRNLSRGAPPPFSLVRFLETLGLETPVPDLAAPVEIIASALAGIDGSDEAEAIREAHASIVEDEIVHGWFEAGDDVEAILETTDSPEDAAQALLESYLPKRRAFWASQCALSALALKDIPARGETPKRLALVGRDILNDVPLDDIPLMRQIAKRSSLAYFEAS